MSRFWIARRWLAALTLLLAVGGPLVAQEPSAAPPADPAAPQGIADQLFNEKPSFLVGAKVNRDSREYRQGDALTISITSEEDAYLYVLYQQADGQTFQVYPNKFQPDNLVKARQAVRVPAEGDLFRWKVGAPYGKEIVKVIATKEPVDILSKPEFKQERFNPVNKQAIKGIEIELGEDKPIHWGETDVEIHTFPNTQPPAAELAKRYGVFFGVSRHHYDKYVVEANGKDASKDLFACHRDARKLAEAMRTAGRLDGIKIFTNEEATKANMQQAITQWLPSVSRPGDTVVIYFSGHTGQMPDRSGDEADGKDEFLVPHDMLGPSEFKALEKLYDDKKLTDGERKSFEQLRSQVEQLGPDASLKLVEATAVTDDQMARWVQRLAGRQVIFISDSCHSGGFAEEETNFKSLQSGGTFDFLHNEAGRLKDLGQSDHALLCAAHTNELAHERRDSEMSVLTYCLVDYLNRPNGAQKIEDCFKFCEVEMQRYFDAINKQRAGDANAKPLTPSHPVLLNHCSQPVYLKP